MVLGDPPSDHYSTPNLTYNQTAEERRHDRSAKAVSDAKWLQPTKEEELLGMKSSSEDVYRWQQQMADWFKLALGPRQVISFVKHIVIQSSVMISPKGN
jgi:hypothetical protein